MASYKDVLELIRRGRTAAEILQELPMRPSHLARILECPSFRKALDCERALAEEVLVHRIMGSAARMHQRCAEIADEGDGESSRKAALSLLQEARKLMSAGGAASGASVCRNAHAWSGAPTWRGGPTGQPIQDWSVRPPRWAIKQRLVYGDRRLGRVPRMGGQPACPEDARLIEWLKDAVDNKLLPPMILMFDFNRNRYGYDMPVKEFRSAVEYLYANHDPTSWTGAYFDMLKSPYEVEEDKNNSENNNDSATEDTESNDNYEENDEENDDFTAKNAEDSERNDNDEDNRGNNEEDRNNNGMASEEAEVTEDSERNDNHKENNGDSATEDTESNDNDEENDKDNDDFTAKNAEDAEDYDRTFNNQENDKDNNKGRNDDGRPPEQEDAQEEGNRSTQRIDTPSDRRVYRRMY